LYRDTGRDPPVTVGSAAMMSGASPPANVRGHKLAAVVGLPIYIASANRFDAIT
jgi:hypothetical protein